MSDKISNVFYAYQEALRRIGADIPDTALVAKIPPEVKMQNEMDELLSSFSNAESSLKGVISAKDSYAEILKMII